MVFNSRLNVIEKTSQPLPPNPYAIKTALNLKPTAIPPSELVHVLPFGEFKAKTIQSQKIPPDLTFSRGITLRWQQLSLPKVYEWRN